MDDFNNSYMTQTPEGSNDNPYFFEPWIGDGYEEGFYGLKTLAVGVCHFCTEDCPHTAVCRNPDSIWEKDQDCPFYASREDKAYYRLSNSNIIEITSFIDRDASYPSYKIFTYYMLKCAGDLGSEKRASLWNRIAFTNYLQFYHNDTEMTPKDAATYDAAYPTFRTLIDRLTPDVVYVWSKDIKECFKRNNDRLRYVGKADLEYGLELYVFKRDTSRLGGSQIAKLRYRLGIKSEKHKERWYKKLLKTHLGASIDTDKKRLDTIKNLANDLYELANAGIIGAAEDHLYFRNSETGVWTSRLKGVFLAKIKMKYPCFGRHFNTGMKAIFKDEVNLDTNKRDTSNIKESEWRINNKLEKIFAVSKKKDN